MSNSSMHLLRRRSLSELIRFASLAEAYVKLRANRPLVPARSVLRFIREADGSLNFEQFHCATAVGHVWRYSGTAYGGEDESFFGEGRVYCSLCLADGDA